MILTQTHAIFYDAYRALRARKMFWIVLILSSIVVVMLAAIGIDKNGMTFFGARVTTELHTRTIPAATIYKLLYKFVGLDIWLAWIASILALISTASIFPAFMTGGSIDLVLCKPIGRVRLFLTQYAAGLLFVILQVSVFSLGCFLVIGIRGDSWELGLFLAVPLVVCFFSYIFAISVFWGVLTRSTLAAILLTLVFWFIFWGLHKADGGILLYRVMNEYEAEVLKERIPHLQREIDELNTTTQPTQTTQTTQTTQPTQPSPQQREQQIADMKRRLEDMTKQRRAALDATKTLYKAQRIIYWIKTFLPKTAETVDLTGRVLISTADLPGMSEEEEKSASQDNPVTPNDPTIQRTLEEHVRRRSPLWIIGTSLAFEFVVLALAAWIFCRRDY